MCAERRRDGHWDMVGDGGREWRRTCRGVDAWADPMLPHERAGVGTAAAGAFEAVVVAGCGCKGGESGWDEAEDEREDEAWKEHVGWLVVIWYRYWVNRLRRNSQVR
jgi:hypothetical protein